MLGAAGGAVLAAVGHVHAKGVVVGVGVGVGVGRPARICHECECAHQMTDGAVTTSYSSLQHAAFLPSSSSCLKCARRLA